MATKRQNIIASFLSEGWRELPHFRSGIDPYNPEQSIPGDFRVLEDPRNPAPSMINERIWIDSNGLAKQGPNWIESQEISDMAERSEKGLAILG